MLREKLLSLIPESSSCIVRSSVSKTGSERIAEKTMGQSINESSSLLVRTTSKSYTDGPEKNSMELSSGDYGTLGSMSIAVNFLTGPAMLEIPALFQKAGLIPTALCIAFTCGFTIINNLHFASALSKLPGNSNFSKEVEYSDAFRKYWPNDPNWFRSTQVIFFLCLTCLNISSLVDSAQVFDLMLANCGFFGSKTHALHCSVPSKSSGGSIHCVYESWNSNVCESVDNCAPFSDHTADDGMLLTAGYLLNVILFMPLALMDLQENAIWQIIEFAVLIITSIVFSILFLSQGIQLDGRLSWWGDSWESLIGVILFNFALVISIPAWLYEKETHVDATEVITGSSVTAAILYIILGTLGAMSGPNVSDNMLETFMSGGNGPVMQVTSFFFAIFIVGLGIPLLSVLNRLNLTGSGYSKSVGNFFAVYIPFGLSWLFYRGSMIAILLTWGGMLFTSVIACLFPILLSLRALDVTDNAGSIFPWRGKEEEKRALRCLLGIAIVGVLVSIVGNVAAIQYDRVG